MKRRAFSLIELLVVLAILAMLAALLFPVFAQAKERAKATNCATRLRNFATALNLYRADHDGLGYRFVRSERPRTSPPFGLFEGMKAYLGDGAILDCTETEPVSTTRLVYRTFSVNVHPGLILGVPPEPRPGSVVAYCLHHASGAWSAEYGSLIREGHYPFVREDASMGVAPSASLRAGYYDEGGWSDAFSGTSKNVLIRFPGEPWPPVPEE